MARTASPSNSVSKSVARFVDVTQIAATAKAPTIVKVSEVG